MRLFFVGRPEATTIDERTRRRVWVHLLPVLFILYILAYIDRSNISVAQFGMNKSPADGGVGFDSAIIGLGSGLFFWSYWVLEIPSTLSVERRGARWVFCRILVLWGLAAALMGFIGMPILEKLLGWIPQLPQPDGDTWIGRFVRHWNGLGNNAESQFYFLRLLLGFFEGGFFPTVIMYLSLWFKAEHRAKAMASFVAAMPLSNMIGTPLSQWIMDNIGWGGLPGWRWIFIIGGIVPVLAGFGVLFCLPDRPQAAKWLPDDERDWLTAQLAEEHRLRLARGHGAWKRHVGLVVLLTVVYFCQNVSAYGMSTFMPAIVKSQIGGAEARASWITTIYFLVGFIVLTFNGWHSDKKQERLWHVAWPMLLTGAGLVVVSCTANRPTLGMAALIFMVGAGVYTHHPAFWAIPTMFLGSTAAASAIGFINMIGNFGGFVGPKVIGDAAKTADFATGLWRIAPFSFVAAAIVLAVGYWRRGETRVEKRSE
jgi:ACS family tartrate transporter-like MFS transporter